MLIFNPTRINGFDFNPTKFCAPKFNPTKKIGHVKCSFLTQLE